MSRAAKETTTTEPAFDPLTHEPGPDASAADIFAHWSALNGACEACFVAGGEPGTPPEQAGMNFGRRARAAFQRLAFTEAKGIYDIEAKMKILRELIDAEPPSDPGWRLLLTSIEGDLEAMRDQENTRRVIGQEAAA